MFSEGEGSGSTFTVQLPMEKARVTAPARNSLTRDLNRARNIRLSISNMSHSFNVSEDVASEVLHLLQSSQKDEQSMNEVETSTAAQHDNDGSNINDITAKDTSFEAPPQHHSHQPKQQHPLTPPLIHQPSTSASQKATYRILLVDDSGDCFTLFHCPLYTTINIIVFKILPYITLQQ